MGKVIFLDLNETILGDILEDFLFAVTETTNLCHDLVMSEPPHDLKILDNTSFESLLSIL